MLPFLAIPRLRTKSVRSYGRNRNLRSYNSLRIIVVDAIT